MPNPSQDTVTLTVTYSLMNAPHVMSPVTRLSGESDDAWVKCEPRDHSFLLIPGNARLSVGSDDRLIVQRIP